MKESKEHNHKESVAGFKPFSLFYLPGTWGFPDAGVPLNNSLSSFTSPSVVKHSQS